MKIIIGSDHRGVKLRKEIIERLQDKKIEVVETTIANNENDDYPDFAFDVAKQVKDDDLGVLICGNGIGISIAANKVKGIRCARVVNTDDVFKARTHNAANIIAFGADEQSLDDAINMIDIFIQTKPSTDERHVRRVNKVIAYEDGEYNEL